MAGTRTASSVFAWCGAAVFVVSLLFFLFCYLVRFGAVVSDTGWVRPVVVDVLLFSVFALHHSFFARASVKERLRRVVPATLERSLYVWLASLLFIAVCAMWVPVPGELYRMTGPVAWVGYGAQVLGIAITLRSSARLDVLDLAGVRQVLRTVPKATPEHVPLETSGLYGFVRHPLYFGWALAVFATPHMTMTRFVFATISTLYLAAAIPLEENALIDTFGAAYRDYQKQVRWRMVPGIY